MSSNLGTDLIEVLFIATTHILLFIKKYAMNSRMCASGAIAIECAWFVCIFGLWGSLAD